MSGKSKDSIRTEFTANGRHIAILLSDMQADQADGELVVADRDVDHAGAAVADGRSRSAGLAHPGAGLLHAEALDDQVGDTPVPGCEAVRTNPLGVDGRELEIRRRG